MIDFEFAAEREDIVRPDQLDTGVGPDPVVADDSATGATSLTGPGALTEATVGLGGEQVFTIPDEAVSFDIDLGGIEPLPGVGFNYEFPLFF